MKKNKRYVMWAFLIIYTIVLYLFTVVLRSSFGYYKYNLTVFWSYKNIIENADNVRWYLNEHFWFNILNIFMMFPIGFLGMALSKKKGRINVLYMGVLGLFMSISIELMQLVLMRGLFEFDDMIHNTIGSMLGACSCILLESSLMRCTRSKKTKKKGE